MWLPVTSEKGYWGSLRAARRKVGELARELQRGELSLWEISVRERKALAVVERFYVTWRNRPCKPESFTAHVWGLQEEIHGAAAQARRRINAPEAGGMSQTGYKTLGFVDPETKNFVVSGFVVTTCADDLVY